MKRLISLLAPLALLLFVSIGVSAQEMVPRVCQVTASTFTDKIFCDVYEVDTTSNAVTITLIAPSRRRAVTVIKTDAGTNTVTVATAGTSATINGDTSYVLREKNEAAVFYANGRTGSNGVWRVTSIKDKTLHYAEVSISSANITGTSAGQLGHANGYPLVAAPGAHVAVELVSAIVINDFATAAYTGGGNISVNYAGGGAALSATVSFANSVGAGADKIAVLIPVTPTNNQLAENTGLNLVAASAPTQPGTAAGVVRVKVTYRLHATGL